MLLRGDYPELPSDTDFADFNLIPPMKAPSAESFLYLRNHEN